MYYAKPSLTFVAEWKHKLLIVTAATLLLVLLHRCVFTKHAYTLLLHITLTCNHFCPRGFTSYKVILLQGSTLSIFCASQPAFEVWANDLSALIVSNVNYFLHEGD